MYCAVGLDLTVSDSVSLLVYKTAARCSVLIKYVKYVHCFVRFLWTLSAMFTYFTVLRRPDITALVDWA